MYSLKEFWQLRDLPVPEGEWDGNVIDYINQHLLMEASYLLRTTSLSVSQIADRLHFADTPSFSRFFSRKKGITPKDYRKHISI